MATSDVPDKDSNIFSKSFVENNSHKKKTDL